MREVFIKKLPSEPGDEMRCVKNRSSTSIGFFFHQNPSIFAARDFFSWSFWPNRKNIGAAKQPSENSSAKLSGGN